MFRPSTTELYDLLKVDKSATKDEIKKAYKKAALLYHPDKISSNATDKEKEMFLQIHHAYEVLFDDDRRANYDMYGITDEQPQPRPQQHQFDMSNIFDMFFNQGGRTNARKVIKTLIINVEITLEEVITGVRREVLFERQALIDLNTKKSVNPKGNIYACEACKGLGYVVLVEQNRYMSVQRQEPCSKCKATGYINVYPNLYKIAPKKAQFVYTFPKGTRNGEEIMIKNQGDINPLDPSNNGDVIFVVKYAQHKRFRVSGDSNIVYHQDVSIFETITGTQFNIQHLDGRNILFKVPHIEPKHTKKINGLGLPQNSNGEITTTSLVIVFNIIYPTITAEQKKLLYLNFDEFYHNTNGKFDQLCDLTDE